MPRIWIALAAVMTLAMPAWAGDTPSVGKDSLHTAAPETLCPQHFAGGRKPELVNTQPAPINTSAPVVDSSAAENRPGGVTRPVLPGQTRTYPLCYTGYADLYSAETRTPLWSAEHLTADRVKAAKGETRTNPFHPDPNVPAPERSELSDYAGGSYDRGHMAPFGDMVGTQAEFESFSLANMAPQSPDDNRGIWAEIERATRGLAARDGDIYVVTGPIFALDAPRLKGRVEVPSFLWKALYDPVRHAGAAYVVPNKAGHEWRQVSLPDLKAMTGVDPFPAADENAVLALPSVH